MVVKTKKTFCVVAYDVADNKRRSKIVKVLEKTGTRINYSVFECMLTVSQLQKIQERIERLINPKEDRIVYYPICVHCFTKITYQPDYKVKPEIVIIS